MYTHVHSCTTPMYTHVHRCALMYTDVHRCTLMYTHVHPCTPMYTHVHSCTPMYTHVHPCTLMYTHVATPMYTHVHPFVLPLQDLYTIAILYNIYSHLCTPCTPVYCAATLETWSYIRPYLERGDIYVFLLYKNEIPFWDFKLAIAI